MQIAEAAMKIDTALLHARRAADDLDRYAQESRLMDVTARARVRMDTALAAKYCRDAVELLVAAHGTSSLADSNRMQRLWRDVHTASHHAITEWQVNLEVYGKALLRRGAEHHAFDLSQGRRMRRPTSDSCVVHYGTFRNTNVSPFCPPSLTRASSDPSARLL